MAQAKAEVYSVLSHPPADAESGKSKQVFITMFETPSQSNPWLKTIVFHPKEVLKLVGPYTVCVVSHPVDVAMHPSEVQPIPNVKFS